MKLIKILLGLWHIPVHLSCSNVSISDDLRYDWYFMISLFKFLRKLTKHKILIVSEVRKNRRIRTKYLNTYVATCG